MARRRTALGMLGLGAVVGWGMIGARLAFGAVPARLTLIFDGS